MLTTSLLLLHRIVYSSSLEGPAIAGYRYSARPERAATFERTL